MGGLKVGDDVCVLVSGRSMLDKAGSKGVYKLLWVILHVAAVGFVWMIDRSCRLYASNCE